MVLESRYKILQRTLVSSNDEKQESLTSMAGSSPRPPNQDMRS